MNVFTPQYLAGLSHRWKGRAEREWPLICRIALQEDREDDRQRIESYVGELDLADRAKMIRNLQSDKQFVTTYGELLIGHVLVAAGYAPRYEPRLQLADGYCTPDWYVEAPVPFICDVFTAGLQQRRDANETALREIEARLSALGGGYMLRLEVPNAATLDAGARKDLALAVRRWLTAGVQKGDTTRIGAATLEVLDIGGARVDVLTSEAVHIVETPAKLAENFEEKAKKYAPLGHPVLAAAVKHYRAEINVTDVEDILFGELAYVSRQTMSGEIIGRTERLPDGVFAAQPELSAAIWLEPYRLPQPLLAVWENPARCNRIPDQVLTRIAETIL